MEDALGGAGEDPSARLRAIATSYVDFALGRPERFRLMFGPSLPADQLSPPLSASTDRALLILEREVAALRPGRTEGRALTIFTWSFVHGLAVLLLDDRLAMLIDEPRSGVERDAVIADAVRLLEFSS